MKKISVEAAGGGEGGKAGGEAKWKSTGAAGERKRKAVAVAGGDEKGKGKGFKTTKKAKTPEVKQDGAKGDGVAGEISTWEIVVRLS